MVHIKKKKKPWKKESAIDVLLIFHTAECFTYTILFNPPTDLVLSSSP